jgi:hypothetical protein
LPPQFQPSGIAIGWVCGYFVVDVNPRARIASYWIVNLVDRQVEVHRGPGGRRGSEGYRHRRVARPGERVAVVVGGRTIASILVEDLLP